MRSSANRWSCYRKTEKEEEAAVGAGSGSGSESGGGSGGKAGEGAGGKSGASEDVPLLSSASSPATNYQSTGIRERRKSPRTTPQMEDNGRGDRGGYSSGMYGHAGGRQSPAERPNADYVMYSEQQPQQQQDAGGEEGGPDGGSPPAHHPSLSHHHHYEQHHQKQQAQYYSEGGGGGRREPHNQQQYQHLHNSSPISPPGPLLEQVNEEVLAVRRSALTVFSPLTYTWVSFRHGNGKQRRSGEDGPFSHHGYDAFPQSCLWHGWRVMPYSCRIHQKSSHDDFNEQA